MSLIQEALKRQHEDLGGGSKAPPPGDDKAPSLKLKGSEGSEHSPAAPTGDSGHPAGMAVAQSGGASDAAPSLLSTLLPKIPVASPPRSRVPVIIASVASVAALAAAGVVLFLYLRPAPPPQKAPMVPAVAPAAAVAAAPSNNPPAQPAVVVPVEQPVVAQQVVQPAVVAGTGPVQTGEVAVAVVTAKPPVVVVQPVVWPPLKINMLLRTANTAVARINNSEYTVGEEVEGAKVVSIERDAVILKYKGETRKLRPGDVAR
ncbi:MAG: hypothetical protein WCL44_00385 [bacterium]